ncbi:MAG: hypothetical protein KDD35_12020, partial [Bdellovibrionales bacterium]|nr:hypothetical protein [Bdellovibrionales bacterium]
LFLFFFILVPSHYLSDLIKKMESFDIIQGRRLFLNEEVSNRLTSYELIDTEIDTYAEDPYWDAFQKTEDWNSLHNHWKYTCTHSLAVRKADFKRLGWFRKTFLFYGFEDVDLGYRFAKDGARFLLNDKAIFHLHPPPSQSEYERSPARRQTILAKTCRIFFHHSLDEAAFNDFRGLLTPSHSFSIELPRINPRSAFFWLHHSFQMVKWRLMWFFFHPAPKAGIQLTGGLLRRAYWRLIWPTMCWFYWRIKVLATWVYWRTYGLAGLVRWRIWGLLKWKLAMPLYYKGGLSLRKIYYYGFERIFWKFVWPCLCWSRWRTTGLANKIYWRTRVLISRLYWRLYASINFFYYHILVRGFWLIFKLSLPLRKPFYILMFQYRKRILRLPEYQKE